MTNDDIDRLIEQAVREAAPNEQFKYALARLAAAATREECAQFLEHGVDLAGMAGSPDLQAFCATLLQGCADALRKGGQHDQR